MKASCEMTVMSDGLRLEYFSTSQTRDEEPRDLQTGETVPFDHARITSNPNVTLYLSKGKTGNGMDADLGHTATVSQPDSPLAVASYRKRYMKKKTSAGYTPGELTSLTFGQPTPGLEARYLGHPLRDEMKALMSGDVPDSNEVFFDDNSEKDERTARLLLSGAPTRVRMYGLGEDWSVEREPENDFHFDGTVLLGAYEETKKRFPNEKEKVINVFAATQADADGLVRVHQPIEYLSLRFAEDGGDSRVVDELAALSVFSRELNDPKYAALQANFALAFLGFMAKELHYRNLTGNADGWYDPLEREHPISWREIRADLSQDAVKQERERLVDVLGVHYESPRPASIKKRRATRTRDNDIFGI